MKRLIAPLAFAVAAVAQPALAATVTVAMYEVNAGGTGNMVGLIVFEDTVNGLRIDPKLRGLTDGQHGTHVHENPACGPKEKDGTMVPGLAAGSHYDPEQTGRHEGPQGNGHLGDLPVLHVDAKGNATRTMRAPRLTTSDIAGRAIVTFTGLAHAADTARQVYAAAFAVATTIAVTRTATIGTCTHCRGADAGNLESGNAANRTTRHTARRSARRTTGHASATCGTTA